MISQNSFFFQKRKENTVKQSSRYLKLKVLGFAHTVRIIRKKYSPFRFYFSLQKRVAVRVFVNVCPDSPGGDQHGWQ